MVVAMGGSDFFIKEGIFYFKNKKIVSIVHNTGGYKFFRPIKNFGYGKEYNQLKKTVFHTLRFLARIKSRMTNY